MKRLNDSLLNTIQIIFLRGEAQEVKPNLLDTLLILGSLGLATSSILWVFRIFIYNLGTVFDAWDTIFSWNNWALTWAAGSIPMNSRLYPQLVPENWSVSPIFSWAKPLFNSFPKASCLCLHCSSCWPYSVWV